MANGENSPGSERESRRDEPVLPPGAPRRARAQLDFGRPPIGGSTAPCRIIDSERKHRGGWLVDC
jgi:hypothetical protein